MSAQISGVTRKPILAAIDLSDHSKTVLEFAAELAHWQRVPLVVLHVIHEPASEPGFYRRRSDCPQPMPMDYLAKQLMDTLMADLRQSSASRCAAEVVLVEGLPTQRILEVAEEHQAAMIVMSSHGRTHLPRLAMGSVAEEVSRRSSVPVTIVKDHWQGWEHASLPESEMEAGPMNSAVSLKTA